MDWPPKPRNVYRTLLLAYPAEFREEYGAEMELAIADGGRWLTLVWDVLRNAPREHLHILARDLRHTARSFAKSPGFTATALLALALGIGAAVTIFSLIDTVLIRSLPFGDAERLVYLWTPIPRYRALPREISPSFADVLAWRKESRSWASITAFRQRTLTLGSGDNTTRIGGALVLGNFFATLQAAPVLGRTIDESDQQSGDGQVAVISYGLWSSQFGFDPAALGKSLQLGGKPYRIIGVMPPEFVYPQPNDYPFAAVGQRTDVWIPNGLTPQELQNRRFASDAAVGRLRPGVSLERAQAEMTAIEKTLDPLNAPTERGSESLLVPFIETAVGPVRPLMRLLAGAVLLVLLIACGNVANLLMARGATREHELGVRTAMGAPRSRLVRQVLTESLTLSTLGGGLGALLGWVAVRVLARMNPGDIPRFEELSVDWRVLLFAVGISLATGILFGAYPALASSRVNVVDLLREGGGRGIAGGSSRVRGGLVVADVALAVVLLGGAVLFLRSYLFVAREDKGFAPSTLTMRLTADLQKRVPPQRMAEMTREAVENVARLPGVTAVGAITGLPLSYHESLTEFAVQGYANQPNQTVNGRPVAGDYFSAMRIPLIAGRYLTSADITGQPVRDGTPVVVSESLARTYFTGRSAIGGRVQQGGPGRPWETIVGVVADVRFSSLEGPPQQMIYEPSWFIDSLAIRTALPPETMIPSVRRAVRSGGAAFVLADIQTMRERTSAAGAHRRFQTALLASFAGVAVLLALVGLYGLLAYSVRQRTAEIGVRMALGAGRGQVVGMVLRQGLTLAVAGLAFGLVGAGLVARAAESLIYGVRVLDPVTFAVVPVLMMGAATVACVVPAWRAARVDAMRALRHQ